jgi:hypothetical protein
MALFKMLLFLAICIASSFIGVGIAKRYYPKKKYMTYVIINGDTLKIYGNVSVGLPPHSTVHGSATDSTGTIELLNYERNDNRVETENNLKLESEVIDTIKDKAAFGSAIKYAKHKRYIKNGKLFLDFTDTLDHKIINYGGVQNVNSGSGTQMIKNN